MKILITLIFYVCVSLYKHGKTKTTNNEKQVNYSTIFVHFQVICPNSYKPSFYHH
ncbi:hypothetical protein CCAN2_1200007 [Capnocytophaga canimorsus]|uniref:Uncharacterized protein n=1 Tax=Capnocytophaga canimorsus TaxID=28188 RepID=A0A0B7HWC5_9FLAO|nr:hypothetical protein CCAN2_1200007 [Capnocytophaga canimorsus]CEN48325.1 hypothetical protein CCAN11_1690004 [Capnocytophaga canimorsus]